jgi:hypothetical protein
MKHYYTTDKTGDTVEVDPADAKQLVASGKKQPSDFDIEDDGQTDTNAPQPVSLGAAADTVVQGTNRSGLPAVDVNSSEGQARIAAYYAAHPDKAAIAKQEYGMGDPFAGINSLAQGARAVLGTPISLASSLVSGTQAMGDYDAATQPGTSRLGVGIEAAKDQYPAAQANAQTGTGVEGVLSDPTNLLAALPGGLVAKGLSRILPEAAKAGKLGYATKVLGGTLEGAGTATASGALDPSTTVGPLTPIAGGILGGSAPAVGQVVSNFGLKHYPNADYMVEGFGEHTKPSGVGTLTPEQLAQQLNSVSFPYTLSKQRAANTARLGVLGEQYEKAYQQIPETGTIGTSAALPTAFDAIVTAQPNTGLLHGQEPTTVDRLLRPRGLPSVADLANDAHLARIQNGPSYSPSTAAVNRQLDAKLADLEENLKLQRPARTISVGLSSMPLVSAKDFGKLRNKYTSQYGPGDPDIVAKKVADELMHTAIVSRLAQEYPPYADYLAKQGTNAAYKQAKTMQHYLDANAPNPRGLSRALPGVFNTYMVPTMMYKAGSGSANGRLSRSVLPITRGIFAPSNDQ